MKRRHFLGSGMGAAALCLAGWSPAQASAQAPRLLVIMLRGGLDSLAAVAPVGDPLYAEIRPHIAPRTLLPLTPDWGLHPSLTALHQCWLDGQMSVVHSTGFGYTGRSHFEGQDIMQSGMTRPYASDTGWLGRAMQLASVQGGVALSIPMPLILRGHRHSTTQYPNWMPRPGAPLLSGLEALWRNEPQLAPYASALRAEHLAMSESGMTRMPYGQARSLTELAKQAAEAMRQPEGPRIGLIDFNSGFDTHANQGHDQGNLADQLAQVDQVVAAFRQHLGAVWQRSLVITLTEFGRTVAENGTTGTDHGVGSCCLVAGGLLTQARVHADWRGLSKDKLFEGRDLPVTIDVHAVHARVLERVLDLSPQQIRNEVMDYRDSPHLRDFLT